MWWSPAKKRFLGFEKAVLFGGIQEYSGRVQRSSGQALQWHLSQQEAERLMEAIRGVPKEQRQAGSQRSKTDQIKGNRREANMRLYRMEIARFQGRLEEAEEMILSFLNGDDSVRGSIIENYLQKVVELAGKYGKRDVAMDEIIAEGNVGLMTAMQIIGQNRDEYILHNGSLDYEKFFGTLDLEITHAMELYIDEVTASNDWESAMLAKTNLLHEATKYMAEEMGRVPTIEELSEYTKIARKEIIDIMGLSEDAKRVAQAEL